MLDLVVILLMIAFAGIAIQSTRLRLSVIALAIFSLLAALLFLLYAAPELAIAETVMGSGLVTLLYLTALKRYRVYTICVVSRLPEDLSDQHIARVKKTDAFREIRQFCRRRERETQLVFSRQTVDQALSNPRFDLVVETDLNAITIYGLIDDYMVVEMELMFQMRRFGAGMGVNFVYKTPDEIPAPATPVETNV